MRISRLVLILLFVLPFDASARKPTKKMLRDFARATQDALATPPQDNEVCFAPDEPCSAKLIKFIATTERTLDIAIFEMTNLEVAEAIAQVAKRARVRMIVNRKLVKDDGPAFDLVKSTSAQVKVGKQPGMMHNKFTLVDGKRVQTGSFNYSYTAGRSNQENQIYLSTPSIVSRYQARFEKMWQEGKH